MENNIGETVQANDKYAPIIKSAQLAIMAAAKFLSDNLAPMKVKVTLDKKVFIKWFQKKV